MSERYTITDMTKYRSLKILYHKNLPHYNHTLHIRKLLAQAYDGCGFIVYNIDKVANRNNIYNCYDINSAYQDILLNHIYPINDGVNGADITVKYDNFKAPDKLYIAYVVIEKLTQKFNNFNYNVFKTHLNLFKTTWSGWLSNIDLELLTKLYNYESMTIYHYVGFTDCDYLSEGLSKFIHKEFEDMSKLGRGTPERAERKRALHIATYGKNAQKDCKLKDSTSYIRSPYIPIGIFQVAYVRQRMVNLMLKYFDDVAYIDTDSIYLSCQRKFGENVSSNLGDFKIENENVTIDFYRAKGYIIYKDGIIVKQKLSGIQTHLTPADIERLNNGEDITVTDIIDGEEKQITIHNKIKKGYKFKF